MSARNRRDLENKELESLAQCLPLAAAITFQLDKVIREIICKVFIICIKYIN
ncbi:unnamed protein product [Brugia pahangi]|uniref:Uncharacterized protein n=1 Tax=Brugia pahangi TaxID=6280 RepID=A0A0N4TFN0_BRUPA|nr:unnamed protein product [Brugia pahangi]